MDKLTKLMIEDGQRNVPLDDAKWIEPPEGYLKDNGESIALLPDYYNGYVPQKTWEQSITHRESLSNYADMAPINLGQLAYVLNVFKVKQPSEQFDGYPGSYRYVPSAGARHPFELIVCAWQVNDLPNGYYRYDGWLNQLIPVKRKTDREDVYDYLQETAPVGHSIPAVIFVEAYFDRTLSRYPHGLSMVYLDAGILLGNMHLAATALDMPSCILGRTAVLSNNKRCTDIGCLLLGGEVFDEDRTDKRKKAKASE